MPRFLGVALQPAAAYSPPWTGRRRETWCWSMPLLGRHVGWCRRQGLGRLQSDARASQTRKTTHPPLHTQLPAPPPTRISRRLRGETAPGQAPRRAPSPPPTDDADRPRGARRGLVHTAPEGTSYSAPFALRSIDVTVTCLGAIHRGAWAPRYWSSGGCLHHHAYPVGYTATKPCFNTVWECAVEAGESGPVFRVTDTANRARTFVGPTPTRPWTDVCVAHRTGQRISGPLFFGFSDTIVQRAVSTLYSPAELAAAQSGEVAASAAPSAAEKAAAAFADRYGVGDKTAQLLALTRSLGGDRHTGPASLEAWARASGTLLDRSQLMLRWLLESEEVPANTRRWPGWRLRIAPRLVAAVFDLPPPVAEGSATETVAPTATTAPSSCPSDGGKENAAPPPPPARKRARAAKPPPAAAAPSRPKGRRASRPPSALAEFVK